MPSSKIRLVAPGKVGVHADLGQKRVVISCETQDGKSIRLAVDLKTLETLHKEIQKQLEPT